MIEIKSLLQELSIKMDGMTLEERNAELDRLDIESYNEQVGNMDLIDGLHCNVCNNKGWVKFYSDGGVRCRRCDCIERRKILMNAKKSGLGEYLNKTLADYIVSNPWQEHCYSMVDNFIHNHTKDNVWFLALGQSGCGKTLMCSIIANWLLFVAKREVIYLTWTDFIGQLKRDIMGEKTNEVSTYLDKVKNADVLFIDEMLKKYNDTDLKYLIEIINYRYTNNLKTIITSENVIEKLLDIDEATFGRAIEKCENFLINIPKDRKKNYRLKGFRRDDI